MSLKLAAFGGWALFAASAHPAAALDLKLSCQGVASMTVPHVTTAQVYGSNGYASAGVVSQGTRQTDDMFSVEIAGDNGRVHVPRSLLPPVHGGGKEDWWDLKELTVTDTEITGRFSLNLFNKPTIRINRLSGVIAMDGLKETFRGTCAPEDVAQRKF